MRLCKHWKVLNSLKKTRGTCYASSWLDWRKSPQNENRMKNNGRIWRTFRFQVFIFTHYHVTNKFLALSSRRESPSLQQRVPFCSLLPFRRKLLCCPSKWVSEWVCVTIESEPSKELCRFRSDLTRSLKLPRRRIRSFLRSILQKRCLVSSSGPTWLNTIS